MRRVISVYVNGEPVECRSDTWRKLRLELGVTSAVREMREPGLACPDFLGGGDRFRDAQMCRMLRAKQRVEDEYADTSESAESLFGKHLGVGDVAEVSDAVPVHRDGAVRHHYRQHVEVSNPKTLAWRHFMRPSLGLARAGEWLDGGVEYIGEARCQALHRVRRPVHVYRQVAPVRESAYVVDAVNVVRVIVS